MILPPEPPSIKTKLDIIIRIVIPASIAFLITYFWLMPSFECELIRMPYWNDKGFFVDTWKSFPEQWTCNYPPIPKGDNP